MISYMLLRGDPYSQFFVWKKGSSMKEKEKSREKQNLRNRIGKKRSYHLPVGKKEKKWSRSLYDEKSNVGWNRVRKRRRGSTCKILTRREKRGGEGPHYCREEKGDPVKNCEKGGDLYSSTEREKGKEKFCPLYYTKDKREKACKRKNGEEKKGEQHRSTYISI